MADKTKDDAEAVRLFTSEQLLPNTVVVLDTNDPHDVEQLRELIELALKDPTFMITTNFPVRVIPLNDLLEMRLKAAMREGWVQKETLPSFEEIWERSETRKRLEEARE